MNEQEILVIVITIKNKNEEKNYALSWSEIILFFPFFDVYHHD